jgi:hypothetical protein
MLRDAPLRGCVDGESSGEVEPLALNGGFHAEQRIIGSGRGVRRLPNGAAVTLRKRNCEMFQALFRASVNHNERQTSGEVLHWGTRALLLGFK